MTIIVTPGINGKYTSMWLFVLFITLNAFSNSRSLGGLIKFV